MSYIDGILNLVGLCVIVSVLVNASNKDLVSGISSKHVKQCSLIRIVERPNSIWVKGASGQVTELVHGKVASSHDHDVASILRSGHASYLVNVVLIFASIHIMLNIKMAVPSQGFALSIDFASNNSPSVIMPLHTNLVRVVTDPKVHAEVDVTIGIHCCLLPG